VKQETESLPSVWIGVSKDGCNESHSKNLHTTIHQSQQPNNRPITRSQKQLTNLFIMSE